MGGQRAGNEMMMQGWGFASVLLQMALSCWLTKLLANRSECFSWAFQGFLFQRLPRSPPLLTAISWTSAMTTKQTATVEQVMTSSWQVQRPSSFHCKTISVQIISGLQCLPCHLSLVNEVTIYACNLFWVHTVGSPWRELHCHFNACRNRTLNTFKTFKWIFFYLPFDLPLINFNVCILSKPQYVCLLEMLKWDYAQI